jgi:hypothetical protein
MEVLLEQEEEKEWGDWGEEEDFLHLQRRQPAILRLLVWSAHQWLLSRCREEEEDS